MCGISVQIYSFDTELSKRKDQQQHDDIPWVHPTTLQRRGPDDSQTVIWPFCRMDFYRLSIQDLSLRGGQPFLKMLWCPHHQQHFRCAFLCNGEFYNVEQLRKELPSYRQHTLQSRSDCEVVVTLFISLVEDRRMSFHTAMTNLLRLLDGEFAFILVLQTNSDLNQKEAKQTFGFVCRDPFGVRPLFMSEGSCQLSFASLFQSLQYGKEIRRRPFPPGSMMTFHGTQITGILKYYHLPSLSSSFYPKHKNMKKKYSQICDSLIHAIKKRVQHSQRPIGALLSGGLDSSLVVAICTKLLKTPVHVFSLGLEDNHSTDLYYAKEVTDHLHLSHDKIHHVRLSVNDALSSIEEVIRVCETFDITTIRASMMQYAIAKYISEKTSIRVILNGDGADEVQMGYLYFHASPNFQEAQKENERLLEQIYKYDGLRVDRCLGHWGLEARLPYLDPSFVQVILTQPIEQRCPSKDRMEKQLIRDAFAICYPDLLPREVLYRQKEAFSDGVSSQEHSWHTIISQHIQSVHGTEESSFYKKVFQHLFHTQPQEENDVCPQYWMPTFLPHIRDPSARELGNLYSPI